jgi:hypothetical protein
MMAGYWCLITTSYISIVNTSRIMDLSLLIEFNSILLMQRNKRQINVHHVTERIEFEKNDSNHNS